MKTNLICLLFALLLLSSSSLAQNTPNSDEAKLPTITYPPIFVPTLLPEKSDSWTINIYTEGGIMGSSYLAIALNSEGQYKCGDKGSLNSVPINNKFFQELSKTVKAVQSDFYTKSLSDIPLYCNDCLYSSLSFYRRPGKTNDKKPQSQTDLPDVKDIYQKVLKVINCETDSKKN